MGIELKLKPGDALPIGNNVKRLLDDRGEGIADLAKGANISYTTVFDLYHGKTSQIKFETLKKLCVYFGVGTAELFPYIPEKRVK